MKPTPSSDILVREFESLRNSLRAEGALQITQIKLLHMRGAYDGKENCIIN